MNKVNENYLKATLGLISMILLVYIGATLFKKFRVDLTQEGLYTLSPGTISVLSKLDSPVKLKLFYSKTAANKGTEALRVFNIHYNYVQELLRQYVSNSRNNLSLEVIDPRPDTPEEEEANAFGLKKFNLSQTESYYFGLVAENESGTEKVIEFFDPQQKDKLEYDLTKLIFTVLNPTKKNIGIISSLEVMKEDVSKYMAQIMQMQGKEVEQSWIVTRMLKDFFNVKKIEQDTDKISGIDALVIIHPKDFPEKTLYAIDQFVLAGGNTLVFVDPVAVADKSGAVQRSGPSMSPDIGFKKLLDKWGVELEPGKLAGDRHLSGVGRVHPSMPPSRLIALLNCNESCTSIHKDTIASNIKTSTFIFPGALKSKNVEGLKVSTIISTSDKGNTYSAAPYEMNNPQALWNKFSDGSNPVPIGMKVVGKYKTAFPDGFKGEKNANEDSHLKESKEESAVVIFSDIDFISDQFAFKNSFLGPAVANGNSTLFLNSVEALVGDVDLMSVRSKGKIDRSFDVINKIEFEAEKKTEDKVKEINASIQGFQSELNELGRKAKDGNVALVQTQSLQKKKELGKKIASLKRELRAVKREGREKVEEIGKFFQFINTLAVPTLVIVFGIFYSRKRSHLMSARRDSSKENNGSTGKLEEAKV